MKDRSVCDVAFAIFLGAAFATSVVVRDWWKHWTAPEPSAIQQELIAPQRGDQL